MAPAAAAAGPQGHVPVARFAHVPAGPQGHVPVARFAHVPAGVTIRYLHREKVGHGRRQHQSNASAPAAAGSASLPTPVPGAVSYNGGSVITTPHVYLDFWGWPWASGFTTGGYSSSTAENYVVKAVADMVGSQWLQSMTQYCQTGSVTVSPGATSCPSGAAFVTNPAGQFNSSTDVAVDNDPNLPAQPTQQQIANEAAAAANHFEGSSPNPNSIIYVLTPSGYSESGFGTQWCGWHSSATSAGTTLRYAYIPFEPDAGAGCGMDFVNGNDGFGHGYFDGYSIVSGHEYAETLSDPDGTSWLDSGGNEVGDKCNFTPGVTDVTFGSDYFAMQPLWSNSQGGCALAPGTLPATPSGVAAVAGDGSAYVSWAGQSDAAQFAVLSSPAPNNYLEFVASGTATAAVLPSLNDGTPYNFQLVALSSIGESMASAASNTVVPAGWQSLGGDVTSAPGATATGGGGVDLFVRGTSGAVWQRTWNGSSWSAWTSLGGYIPPGSSVAAVETGGDVDIFVRGGNNALWQNTLHSGVWSGWRSLGGNLTDSPAAASQGANQMDVFVRGTDGGVWQLDWNGSWSGWLKRGGYITSSPAAISPAAGTVDVVAKGGNNALWELSEQGGTWSGWTSLGGNLLTGAGLASWSSGHIDLFAVGTNDGVWQRSFDAGAWGPWTSDGGRTSLAPAEAATGVGANDLFVIGTNNAVWKDVVN